MKPSKLSYLGALKLCSCEYYIFQKKCALHKINIMELYSQAA